MKALNQKYQKTVNYVGLTGVTLASTSAFAAENGLDMSSTVTLLGGAVAAVAALGAAKMAPAAIMWVWGLLTRAAQR